jgi:hypothetical protein
MTTMREALTELGWNEELIRAFTQSPQYSVSAPMLSISVGSTVLDRSTLIVDFETPTLSSGVNLVRA